MRDLVIGYDGEILNQFASILRWLLSCLILVAACDPVPPPSKVSAPKRITGKLLVRVIVPEGESADIASDGRMFDWKWTRGLGVSVFAREVGSSEMFAGLINPSVSSSSQCFCFEAEAWPGEYLIEVGRNYGPNSVTRTAKVASFQVTEVEVALPALNPADCLVIHPEDRQGKPVPNTVVWVDGIFARGSSGFARCMRDGSRWIDLLGIASRFGQVDKMLQVTVESQDAGTVSIWVEYPYKGDHTVILRRSSMWK